MVIIRRDGGTNKFYVLDWLNSFNNRVGLSWENWGIAITFGA